MRLYLLSAALLFLNACNNSTPEKKVMQNNADTVIENPSFFPVTDYLKGQIYDIKQKGLTPIKYTTVNGHTDSVMIKFDQLNELLKAFLQPEIDSANLVPYFNETKFLDQSIDAFTFTYEAKSQLPDTLLLRHWDVYVEPETGKVKRIYIIKKEAANKTLQLTWQSDKWCKTTTIINNPDGTAAIEKEEKISWDY